MPRGSQAAPGTPTKGPLALPSFISLSSSPEEADAPDTVPAETSQVKGPKIHKPTYLVFTKLKINAVSKGIIQLEAIE